MGRFKISIGDWSQDGHNQYDQFVFSSNYSVKEMQKAYKNSCQVTGLQFDDNENYTDRAENNGYRSPYQIWTEYEDCSISEEVAEILMLHGILPQDYDFETDDKYSDPFEAAKLILDFIKLSLPDLKVKEAAFINSELEDRNAIKPLNGWWCKDLNVQFGYGLYY